MKKICISFLFLKISLNKYWFPSFVRESIFFKIKLISFPCYLFLPIFYKLIYFLKIKVNRFAKPDELFYSIIWTNGINGIKFLNLPPFLTPSFFLIFLLSRTIRIYPSTSVSSSIRIYPKYPNVMGRLNLFG